MADDWTSAFRKLGWSPDAGATGAQGSSTRFTIPPAGGGGGARSVDPYLGLVKDTASRHGLNPSLLAGIWDFESSGNPGAINKSSGATGLGQVMPREAGAMFRDRPSQQELLNPETNAEWSARILKSGLDRYGSEDKALAAYLGAIDARGNITGAVDANGTGGNQYIRTVRERQQRYADLTGATGTGASGRPSGSGAPANALTSGDDWTAAFKQLGWSPESGPSGQVPNAPRGPVQAAPQQKGPEPGWLQLAQTQIGKPYIWGSGSGAGGRGTGDIDKQTGQPNGFDCSGYVSWVYKNALGVDIPAYTGSAYPATKAIAANEAQAGDLVFYNMNTNDPRRQHVAIYLGDGRVIQSGGAGDGVNIAPVDQIGNLEFRRSPRAQVALAQAQPAVAAGATTAQPSGPLYLQGTVTPTQSRTGGDGWEQAFLAQGWRP